MKSPKITVIGSSNMDMVVRTDHIPAPGETVLSGSFFMNAGGKGANQTVAVARLGGQVSFISKLGNDVFGQQFLQLFRDAGVDTRYIISDGSLPSGVALITVDKGGENSIVVASGANASLKPQDIGEDALKNIAESSILLMQLETPMETVEFAAAYASTHGVKVILNPAPFNTLTPELLSHIDIITPNQTEAEKISGISVTDIDSSKEAAKVICEKGVNSVIITMGAHGSVIYHDNGFFTIPAQVVEAVDTTAAGDVFNGALAVALSEGQDLPEAVDFASRAAAIYVTRLGAQQSIPYRNELQSFFRLLSVLAFVLLFSAFVSPSGYAQPRHPIPIIFETDMGNDVDDALALDMLYKLQDQGRVRLLGISCNKDNPYSIPFLRIMNNWYGYPDIPLGKVQNGINSTADAKDYAQAVYDYQHNGEYVFRKYLGDSSHIMGSVKMYRMLLAGQPDAGVSVVSVGFSTNIARLLDSKPDSYSKLTGRELIKKKVKMLYLMAGSFDGQMKGGEYNVFKDTPAAKKVFDEWPTAIVTSPFEVGIRILYPASSIENDLTWTDAHPLKVAYESYLPMPYDRPTWDPTAMWYAVTSDSAYFNLSPRGRISVGAKGRTSFTPEKDGPHRYLMVDSMQAARIRSRFIELVKIKPAHLKN